MSSKIRPNPNSQYDPGLVLKDVHDFDGQALRIVDSKSLISGNYSHFSVTYNSANKPTNVKYFRGLQPRITEIECFSDFNGNLNNKYLVVYSNPEKQKYHIWFSVDSLGVDPAPANSIGIKVDISENDPAIVVATAMTLVINSLYKNIFTASKAGVKVSLMTVGYGIGLNSSDFNTAFGIVNFDGEEELVSDIIITYDSAGNPIYNGQVLKDYYYDIYSGKFEKSQAGLNQELGLLFEQATPTIMYLAEGLFGALPSEAKWKIKKIDTSSGVRITLASQDFDQIWNNRASLSYS